MAALIGNIRFTEDGVKYPTNSRCLIGLEAKNYTCNRQRKYNTHVVVLQ